MEPSKASPDQLSEYIHAIEKEQRSKIRTRLIGIIISLFFLVFTSLVYIFFLSDNGISSVDEYVYLDPGVYSIEYIDSLLKVTDKKVLFNAFPDSGYDTIKHISDFPTGDTDEIIVYNSTQKVNQKSPTTDNTPQIPEFGLEIEGYRTVGTELKFSIIGYQNIFTYQIDFGNGQPRIMGKTFTYKYNEAGKYTVQLKATSQAYAPRIFSVPLSISKVGANIEEHLPPTHNQLTANQRDFSVSNLGEDYPSRGEKKSLKNYIPPSFPGGQSSLANFIQQNLIYPSTAINNNIQGEVIIKFLVESDGSISSLEIKKGLGYGCDDEVIRIVEYMPKWIPGSLNGKKIAMPYSLPIRFQL